MKNILLGAALLLAANGAFGQLTVKPTSNGDPSYMYIKDQVVYVESDINLTVNPGTDYEASIYLRDGGQLIQGDHPTSTSTNTGNGYLSVQQKTKPTNAYAYYHWASPVGDSETHGGSSGNINFGINSVYEALGTPSGPGDDADLAIGTRARKAETTPYRNGFNEPYLTISTRWLYTRLHPRTEEEAAYQRIDSLSIVPPGYGFTMKGVRQGANTQPNEWRHGDVDDNWEQRYEFRGRPNSGTFTIDVDGPDSPGNNPNVPQRMTLSGNPYPSALDLNWVFYEPGNEELDAFYYYDADRTVGSHFYSDKSYGFASWVPGGTSRNDNYPGETGYTEGLYTAATFYIWNKFGHSTGPGNPNNNSKTATRIAPIGQGIMFAGSSSGTVEIKNSHRRFIKEGTYSVFHKPAPNGGNLTQANVEGGDSTGSTWSHSATEIADIRTPQLRLYVVFDDALTRDLLLAFDNEATDSFDRGFDAPSPLGMGSDAFYPIQRNDHLMPFVINGTNYSHDKRIPIAFTLDKQRKINVMVAEEIRKPYREVFLYDSYEHRYWVLTQEELRGISFSLPAGDYLDRFYICFARSSFGMPFQPEDVTTFKAQVDVFQNNPNQQLEIKNPYNYDIKSMNVFDMTGKLVIAEKNLGERGHYSFPTGNLSDGVYIVKMTTTSDMQIDYKVVVMNR